MSDVIKLHDLRPAPGEKKAKTRVGRGEGSKGKTAGRGTKGTKARKNVPVAFEGGQMPIHMRLPKLKGFRNRFRTEYDVVNVADLADSTTSFSGLHWQWRLAFKFHTHYWREKRSG